MSDIRSDLRSGYRESMRRRSSSFAGLRGIQKYGGIKEKFVYEEESKPVDYSELLKKQKLVKKIN
jgi:hypothetical protein